MPKAVLVEDNLMFGMMVEPTLKRLGYEVCTVGSGNPAAVLAAEPDLVLINLTSMRYNGPDVVRELRSQTDIPIIGYAGHVERHYFQQGKEAGATLVVPNSAMRKALPEVLAKLDRRLTDAAEPDWPDED
jgi:CheY-like chemotaxis protein